MYVNWFLSGLLLLPAGAAALYQARRHLEATAWAPDCLRQPHSSGVNLCIEISLHGLRGGPHSKLPGLSGTPTELNNPRNKDRKDLRNFENGVHLEIIYEFRKRYYIFKFVHVEFCISSLYEGGSTCHMGSKCITYCCCPVPGTNRSGGSATAVLLIACSTVQKNNLIPLHLEIKLANNNRSILVGTRFFLVESFLLLIS